MNSLIWKKPVYHRGPETTSQPAMLIIDEPDAGGVTGDVNRTPHIFGGLSPLAEVASRIAAGLDPRTFLDPSESWNADGIESQAMLEAIDKAVGMSAVYAHKLLQRCAALTQLEIEHAQEETRQQAAQQAMKQNGRANGRGKLELP